MTASGEEIPFDEVLNRLNRWDRVRVEYDSHEGDGVKQKTGKIEEMRALRGGTPRLILKMEHINTHSQARWNVTLFADEPDKSFALGSRITVTYRVGSNGGTTTDHVGTPLRLFRLPDDAT